MYVPHYCSKQYSKKKSNNEIYAFLKIAPVACFLFFKQQHSLLSFSLLFILNFLLRVFIYDSKKSPTLSKRASLSQLNALLPWIYQQDQQPLTTIATHSAYLFSLQPQNKHTEIVTTPSPHSLQHFLYEINTGFVSTTCHVHIKHGAFFFNNSSASFSKTLSFLQSFTTLFL